MKCKFSVQYIKKIKNKRVNLPILVEKTHVVFNERRL